MILDVRQKNNLIRERKGNDGMQTLVERRVCDPRFNPDHHPSDRPMLKQTYSRGTLKPSTKGL